MIKETQIEDSLITKLTDLKYSYRSDIRDKVSLEHNFREKFQALNRVNLSDSEFAKLRDEIINADVFNSSKRLREINTFMREDGTPLHYTLVNIKDWCKNEFEVINQLRINTQNSHHRYDVILLINGIPVVQIELKGLEVSPRRAMQQIVETYRERNEEIRYSRRVSMDEIKKNEFNLNISRYVSTSEDEIQIDLKEVNKTLVDLDKNINKARDTHNKFLNELGLPPI